MFFCWDYKKQKKKIQTNYTLVRWYDSWSVFFLRIISQ